MSYSEIALKYLGTKAGDSKHHAIIDGYNKHCLPLPRGYKVKYTDPWCATFVSYILYLGKAKNPPYECSVYYMMEKARKNKQIVKNPKVNDVIIYDWLNNGSVDHVGIIYKIVGNTLYVVEGNKSNSVSTRIINKKSPLIECYIRVKSKNVSRETSVTDTPDIKSIVIDVVRGKYGNNPYRKQKLVSKYGYNKYCEIQNMVNHYIKNGYKF
jgi:hypothetical protein